MYMMCAIFMQRVFLIFLLQLIRYNEAYIYIKRRLFFFFFFLKFLFAFCNIYIHGLEYATCMLVSAGVHLGGRTFAFPVNRKP